MVHSKTLLRTRMLAMDIAFVLTLTGIIHSLKLPVFPGCHLANLPKSQTVRMAICVLTICAHSLSRPEIYDFCSLLVGNVRIVAFA